MQFNSYRVQNEANKKQLSEYRVVGELFLSYYVGKAIEVELCKSAALGQSVKRHLLLGCRVSQLQPVGKKS